MEQGRGLEVKSESATVEKLLTLAPGENRVDVVAFTSDGSVASQSVGATFTVADSISDTPRLFVLAVGVNDYRDKALRLKYASPDARALTDSLKGAGGRVFESVTVQTLLDEHATSDGIRKAIVELGKKVRTSDVFVFYLAGHGITLDGRYHFLPVDFRYRNEDSIRTGGVTQENLRDWMSEVPALKSLVLLDTCNSGSFVEAQMATRGLAEKTAIDKLTRATGRATIAASSDTQVAIEGHEGHGVFTWVLLEGFRKADANRDGVLSTAELASFVDARVPELTYKRWGYEQVPQVMLHGREFPIGVIR
jgi:uncharacterized caspase-like protein